MTDVLTSSGSVFSLHWLDTNTLPCPLTTHAYVYSLEYPYSMLLLSVQFCLKTADVFFLLLILYWHAQYGHDMACDGIWGYTTCNILATTRSSASRVLRGPYSKE